LDGVPPLTSDSGEIILALDWSTLSGFGPSTSTLAAQLAPYLFATNFIADLNGHALAELPLHFAGHSRGASLVAELARILGAQGIWVDQVTTLDPYPLSVTSDPAMKNYANVFFSDNYWQTTDIPSGQSLPGAYNRFLSNLSGGYPSGSAHSDVHLWYHGTIDLATPAMDNSAIITAAERTNWWTALEARGTNTGFRWSLIAGGDRLSTLEPNGSGNGRVNDGFNRFWDLGAGVTGNRSALPANNGTWPNVIRCNLAATNPVSPGQSFSVGFYSQFGSNTLVNSTVKFYADRDLNPYDGNETFLVQTNLSGTGTNAVTSRTVSVVLNSGLLSPGSYWVFAREDGGGHTRYLYAPEKLIVQATSVQPPVLLAQGIFTNSFRLTVNAGAGQTIVVQASTNLQAWQSIQTNLMTNSSLTVDDPIIPGRTLRYYRALQLP